MLLVLLSYEVVRYKRDLIFLDVFGPGNVSVTDITSSSAVIKWQRPWTDGCDFYGKPTFYESGLLNGMIGCRLDGDVS